MLKGSLMGAADVVPGVSGGTIAFITGIYEELLESISAINLDNLKLLFKGQFKIFWNNINGKFFVFLLTGVAFSLVTLAKLIGSIVNNSKETEEKVLLWSFFFGLIIASILYVGKQIKKWTPKEYASLLIGAGIAFYITIASPAVGSDSLIYLFISGLIAICAMILPGISGAFILLLMGSYPLVLGAVNDLREALSASDTPLIIAAGSKIAVFGLGCVIGLTSFARLVSYMFKKAHDITLAVLTGFLIGSLNKVWPWKQTTEFRENSHGEMVPYLQENLLPHSFAEINNDNYLVFAALLCILGFAIVFVMEKVGERFNTTT